MIRGSSALGIPGYNEVKGYKKEKHTPSKGVQILEIESNANKQLLIVHRVREIHVQLIVGYLNWVCFSNLINSSYFVNPIICKYLGENNSLK